MNRKIILLTGIFVILFLALPVTTTAQEVTSEQGYVLDCPSGHRSIVGLQGYGRVDFGFDNFTITEFMLNISATSMLDIRVSVQVILSDFNMTYVEIYREQTMQCNLTYDDFFDEHKVFNSSRYYSWMSNSTHEITTYRYYYMTPRFLIEIENIGHADTFVIVDRLMIIETYGDREVEIEITLRQGGIYTPITVFTFPTDSISSTTPTDRIITIPLWLFQSFVIGLLVIGAGIGALFVMVTTAKMNI